MADNRINIVISAQDLASGKLKDVAYSIEETGKRSERSGNLVDGLRSSLGTAAVALGAISIGAATAGSTIGFRFNSSVEQAQAKLMAFMRDGEKVAETLQWVKKEAAETQFNFADMADAAAQLTPTAKFTGIALQDLIKQAEILAALNPAEGLTGAVFSLREALSNDWVSIVERFNLPRKRINELRDQGVPAMQAISTVLKEMGIDYSLVSKQGQTTAARFEQLKDKLTMLAGAAAKPIFDKVSEGLDALNKQDYTSIGDKLAALSQTFVDAFDLLATGKYKDGTLGGQESPIVNFLLGLRDAAIQVWQQIEPPLKMIWSAIVEDLGPALKDYFTESAPMWKLYGAGVVLVLVGLLYAIYGVIKGVAWLIRSTTEFGKWVNNEWKKTVGIVASVAESIKSQWEAMVDFVASIPDKISQAWQEFTDAVVQGVDFVVQQFIALPTNIETAIGFVNGWLVTFVTTDIPNFINGIISWFQSLPGKVTETLLGFTTSVSTGMTETSQAAQGQAASLVSSVVAWFQSLPGQVAAAVSSLWNTAVGAFMAFKDSAVGWATQTVNAIVNLFLSLPGRITSAVQGALNGAQGQVSEFLSNFTKGFNAGAKRNAIGTAYSPGGVTLVGENGPELVNLPQGAQVTQAYQTRSQGGTVGQGGISLNFYGPVSTKNEDDLERLARRVASMIDQSGSSLARGMAA